MNFGPLEVLKYTKRIVEDGGDPRPCALGSYCLRCCAAIAKGDLDKMHGTEMPLREVVSDLLYGLRETPGDLPMTQAIDLIATRDKGIVHTRESALELLNELIARLG